MLEDNAEEFVRNYVQKGGRVTESVDSSWTSARRCKICGVTKPLDEFYANVWDA